MECSSRHILPTKEKKEISWSHPPWYFNQLWKIILCWGRMVWIQINATKNLRHITQNRLIHSTIVGFTVYLQLSSLPSSLRISIPVPSISTHWLFPCTVILFVINRVNWIKLLNKKYIINYTQTSYGFAFRMLKKSVILCFMRTLNCASMPHCLHCCMQQPIGKHSVRVFRLFGILLLKLHPVSKRK